MKALPILLAALAGIVSAADFKANDYGAKASDDANNTEAIQKAIDAAAEAGGGTVVFDPGLYPSGAIFVKSGVTLHLEEGVTIQAIQDDALYPDKPTRVAGIEMEWPAALVNVYEVENAKITGKGAIDGNGQYWWHKFWGEDGESGMLGPYRAKGLRWAVDYDCKRVRALAVYKSKNVEIHDVSVLRSGFWSVTLTYSEKVVVDGVKIRANIGGFGPSSDGVDIDSSKDVLVQNCDIDCNDDNICLKAGRDSDGLRVNRPCENITIRNCITRSGHGMLTLGSETSGGIRNVTVENITAIGTSNGVRIKSARVRGGGAENVKLSGLKMIGVKNPLQFELNWYPAYSYPEIPDHVDQENMPRHWKVLTTRVEPPEKGIPMVRNLEITDLHATGADTAIYANAYPEKPMMGIRLKNVTIEAKEAGKIANAADWSFENVTLRTLDDGEVELENVEGVEPPETAKLSREDWQAARDKSGEADHGAVQLGVGNDSDDE